MCLKFIIGFENLEQVWVITGAAVFGISLLSLSKQQFWVNYILKKEIDAKFSGLVGSKTSSLISQSSRNRSTWVTYESSQPSWPVSPLSANKYSVPTTLQAGRAKLLTPCSRVLKINQYVLSSIQDNLAQNLEFSNDSWHVSRMSRVLISNMNTPLEDIDGTSTHQGRIYVANGYPTFARTMSMVGQKLSFSRQITYNVRQNMSVLMKNMQILG